VRLRMLNSGQISQALFLCLLLSVILVILLSPMLHLGRTTLVKAETEPETEEAPYIPPQVEQPYYADGRWFLPGVVLEARTIKLFGRPVDLALVQYSNYQLWAALGVQGSQNYESFLDDTTNRPEMLSQLSLHLLNPERFSFTLYLPEPVASPEGFDWTLCQPELSEFCRLANLQENSGPLHIDLPRHTVPASFREGQSNLFVQKGYFPEQYRQALLVWRIAIVEN
jgi:hypothetical protein